MAYKNKEDQAAASKRHYESNKGKVRQRTQKRNRVQRKRNRVFVDQIKALAKCVDCGEGNPLVLDFDHVTGEKVNDVSNMVYKAYCLESIQKEIDKCEVRCANCHRIVTHTRRVEKKIKSHAETNSKGAT
jgi:hypothetical protein